MDRLKESCCSLGGRAQESAAGMLIPPRNVRTRTSVILTVVAAVCLSAIVHAQTQTTPEAIEKVGGPVSPPRPIYDPEPEFSESARAVGYEGVCTLGVIVGADGKPSNIRVINAIGMGLDEKAIEAVRSWRFSPALKDGKPVAVQIAVEVDFHLYGKAHGKFADLSAKAQAGDAEAQLELANLFLKQRRCSPEDEALGLRYLGNAANQGLPRAQFLMGEHIARDGSANFPKAYMWYTLARGSGYKHSDKALKELTARMTSEQLQVGLALVDGWKPRPAH